MKTLQNMVLLAAGLLLYMTNIMAREVRVYNWSDYIDPALIEEFTQQTGIKVIYDTYDSNDVLLAKLLVGNSGYDVAVPTAYTVRYLIQAERIQAIERDKLTNAGNIWGDVTERLKILEGVNDYSIPYMWSTTGIAYDENRIATLIPDAPTDSMALLFDPQYAAKLSSCGLYLLDSPNDVIGMALLYLGYSASATDEVALNAANELLKGIRPYVTKFHSSEYINAMANGDACIAMGWSGDLYLAKARAIEADNGVALRYFIPEEGALVGYDQFVVLKESKNIPEAYAFIDYMLDAQVNARAADFVEYATANEGAFAFTKPELINDPGLYPPMERLNKLSITLPYTPSEQRQILKMWLNLKDGR